MFGKNENNPVRHGIEDKQVIEKILKPLGLWDQKGRPPPKANTPPMAPEYHIDYTDFQVPVPDNYLYVGL